MSQSPSPRPSPSTNRGKNLTLADRSKGGKKSASSAPRTPGGRFAPRPKA